MQLVIFTFYLSLMVSGMAYQKPFLLSFYGTHIAQHRQPTSNRVFTSRLYDSDNRLNKYPSKSSSERLQKISQLRNFTQHDANKVLNSMMRNMDQVELKQVCSLLQNNLDVQAANIFVPDHISMSTAIARCARLSMYVEAIELFEALQTHKIPFDMITLRSAIRAAANIRQWNYTLELLNLSYREFGASTLELVAIALESLKFITSLRETPRYIIAADVMSKMQQLLSWMAQHKLTPSLAVKESSLLLYCQYGSDQECDVAFAQLKPFPSLKACGMMLDRAARQGDEPRARSLLLTMQQNNLQLDQVMYNMLLKLCAVKGDTIWAQEVLQHLRSSGGYVDDYAATSLVKLGLLRPQQLHSRTNTIESSSNQGKFLLPVTAASSFAYSTAITQLASSSSSSSATTTAATNAATIVQLLHEAEQRQCVDYAVYIAAATAQIQQDTIPAAMTTIRRLITHNPQFLITGDNPFKQITITISFVIDHLLTSDTGFVLLMDLLTTINQSYPLAVQQAIANSLPRLITKQQPFLIIGLLQRFLSSYLLPRRSLDALLLSLQDHESEVFFLLQDEEVTEYQPKLQVGSQLLISYLHQQCSLFAQAIPTTTTTTPTSNRSRRLPMGIKVMEVVLQSMIMERDAATMVSIIANNQPVFDLFNLLRGQTIPSLTWRPTGKILFLLSRHFLLLNDVDHAGELLLAYSGSFPKPLLPATLVGTTVSALYAAGRKALALDLFALFAGKKVDRIRQTWSSQNPTDDHNDNDHDLANMLNDEREEEDEDVQITTTVSEHHGKRGLLLDLHYQSRGMAYVLLLTSLEQIAEGKLFANSSAKWLTIITGKNLPKRLKRQKEEFDSSTISEPFRLGNEVQQILIDEFYPPIPSSTEPGNPGRVRIRLEDVKKTQRAKFRVR